MKHIKKCLILAVAGLPLLNSCSDSWLEPKPLSIYTPENTYVYLQPIIAQYFISNKSEIWS